MASPERLIRQQRSQVTQPVPHFRIVHERLHNAMPLLDTGHIRQGLFEPRAQKALAHGSARVIQQAIQT
jgi:hypothetical protein